VADVVPLLFGVYVLAARELVLVVTVTETEDGAAVEEPTLGVEVWVSEKREPVRLYAAAQAERDIPLGQHQVPPVESLVQKYPSSQLLPVPSGQQVCWISGS